MSENILNLKMFENNPNTKMLQAWNFEKKKSLETESGCVVVWLADQPTLMQSIILTKIVRRMRSGFKHQHTSTVAWVYDHCHLTISSARIVVFSDIRRLKSMALGYISAGKYLYHIPWESFTSFRVLNLRCTDRNFLQYCDILSVILLVLTTALMFLNKDTKILSLEYNLQRHAQLIIVLLLSVLDLFCLASS
jgi:hypothetical protein